MSKQLKMEQLRVALDALFAEAPVSFPRFLKCFEVLGDTRERSEEYFRLFAQMHYVVQRNTKEEVLEQLLSRHGLPARWDFTSAPPQQPPPAPAAPDPTTEPTERIGADVVAMVEREAVRVANEAVLELLRQRLSSLRKNISDLETHAQQLDADISAADASVQAAAEPFSRLRNAAQQQ